MQGCSCCGQKTHILVQNTNTLLSRRLPVYDEQKSQFIHVGFMPEFQMKDVKREILELYNNK